MEDVAHHAAALWRSFMARHVDSEYCKQFLDTRS
jgi:hypothetical protein